MDVLLGNLAVVTDKVVDCVVLGGFEDIDGMVPDEVDFWGVWVNSVEFFVDFDRLLRVVSLATKDSIELEVVVGWIAVVLVKDSDIVTFLIFSDVESVLRVATEIVIVLGWLF